MDVYAEFMVLSIMGIGLGAVYAGVAWLQRRFHIRVANALFLRYLLWSLWAAAVMEFPLQAGLTGIGLSYVLLVLFMLFSLYRTMVWAVTALVEVSGEPSVVIAVRSRHPGLAKLAYRGTAVLLTLIGLGLVAWMFYLAALAPLS